MAEKPILVTEHDVKDPNLLLRYLRKISDGLVQLGTRIGRLEGAPPPPSIPEIRDALEATGEYPLHLGELIGQTGDPQPALVTHYDTTPTGLILQGLKDGQLVTVGSSSTGDTLYRVVAGNPNTLRQISPVVSGSIVEVPDNTFTVYDEASTSRKMQVNAGSITPGATRVMTIPDTDQILAGRNVNNSFTTSQTVSQAINGGLNVTLTNTSTGTSANAGVSINSDSANANIICHSSTRALTRFGTNLASWTEMIQTGGTGMIVGTFSNAPLVFGTNNTEAGRFDTSQNLHLEQRISEYLNETAVGAGVPFIVARAAVSNTSASSTGVLYSYTPPVAGEYRLSYEIFTRTTGTGLTTVSYVFSNEAAGWTITSAGIALAGLNREYTSTIIHAATSGNIGIVVNVGTSTVAPVGTYSFYSVLEKLST